MVLVEAGKVRERVLGRIFRRWEADVREVGLDLGGRESTGRTGDGVRGWESECGHCGWVWSGLWDTSHVRDAMYIGIESAFATGIGFLEFSRGGH